MNKLIIFITIVVLTAFSNNTKAQRDSIDDMMNFIFQNLNSDTDSLDNLIDNQSQISLNKKNKKNKKTDNQDINYDDQTRNIFMLKRHFNAGKYSDALQLSETIRQGKKLSQQNNAEFMQYYSSALKASGYDYKADSIVKLFIKKNPFYTLNESDPIPFKEIYSNYYCFPKFSVWASGGFQAPVAQVDTVHVVGTKNTDEPDYSEVSGICFELGLQYNPWKYIGISLAAKYELLKYLRTVDHELDMGGFIVPYTFVYQENIQILSIPIKFIFTCPTKKEKWVPELHLGFQPDFLTRVSYDANTQYGGNSTYSLKENKIDLKEKNRINYSICSSIRINRNFKRFTFFGEVNSDIMLKPYNNPKYNLSNANLVYNKLFVQDALHLSTIGIHFGMKIKLAYRVLAKYDYGYLN